VTTDQILTLIVGLTGGGLVPVLVPRILDLLTGAQGRRRDELREAWASEKAAQEGWQAEQRRVGRWIAHDLELQRIIIRHGAGNLIPEPPDGGPALTPTPSSIIQPPVRGPIDNP